MDVAVVGGSGYGGGELLRLLAGHPHFKVALVAARASAGRRVDEVFPHLTGIHDGTLVAPDPDRLADCDLVFLATPHAASLELAPPLVAAGTLVVDLSAAFRLPADTFTEWYGHEHTAPGLAPAAYGLPELRRPALQELADRPGGRLVAAPGCYPTAALLALAPVAGLIDADSVVVTGLSGSSGAGKGLRDDLHASHAFGNVVPYGAPAHRHTPEIAHGLAAAAGLDAPAAVSFTPHLVPAARGLVATAVAALAPGAGADEVADSVATTYAGEAFVHALPAGAWPATTHVVGGNGAHVAAVVDERTRRVTASCAIDNLGKGAAGQAIQAANAVLGLPEEAGLSTAGVYP